MCITQASLVIYVTGAFIGFDSLSTHICFHVVTQNSLLKLFCGEVLCLILFLPQPRKAYIFFPFSKTTWT